MPDQTVTLELSGAPTVEDYATALGALHRLLQGLARTHAQGTSIAWPIDSLATSSAITTLIGVADDDAAVERVASAFLDTGEEIASGEIQELVRADPDVYEAARTLRGILNGRVPAIRFETAEDDVTVVTETAAVLPKRRADRPKIPGAFGAVEGRIQTLTSRSRLRFTIYDLIHDRAVNCYLTAEQQQIMPGLWDRLAVVEGFVTRDVLTGHPTAVRRIRKITPIEPAQEGAWFAARGAASSNEPAEAIIRRIRDGW